MKCIASNQVWFGPLFCPFCGALVVHNDGEDLSPCDHTLFVLSDGGYEHASTAFLKSAGITIDELDDFGPGGKHKEHMLIDRCELDRAFYFDGGPGPWAAVGFYEGS